MLILPVISINLARIEGRDAVAGTLLRFRSTVTGITGCLVGQGAVGKSGSRLPWATFGSWLLPERWD